MTFVVRVDLGAAPPVWRRVELPSTLMLDELQDLLQPLFGWTDSHLYRFALGASVWDRDAELFLCPYDVDAGEQEGTPTCEVRLDETLADVGTDCVTCTTMGTTGRCCSSWRRFSAVHRRDRG